MPETILGIPQTTCNLCKHKIDAEPIPILGEDAGAKVQRLMQRIMVHYQERHPNQLLEIVRASQHYTTMLILQQFDLVDPPLIEARESARKFAEECFNKNRPS
jgi:hypothetical protein